MQLFFVSFLPFSTDQLAGRLLIIASFLEEVQADEEWREEEHDQEPWEANECQAVKEAQAVKEWQVERHKTEFPGEG